MSDIYDYTIELRRIPDSLGGGYIACIPQLGKFAFVGDGDTPEESLKSLGECFTEMAADMAERGVPLPPPQSFEEWDDNILSENCVRPDEELQTISDRINKYQSLMIFHPLTCGNESSHSLLKPEIVDQYHQLILRCPDCDYRQSSIPVMFHGDRAEMMDELIRVKEENPSSL